MIIQMAITDGSGDGVGVTRLQRVGKDNVKKEIFNIDIWCLIFEKASSL
jgi:hypothetical protein